MRRIDMGAPVFVILPRINGVHLHFVPETAFLSPLSSIHEKRLLFKQARRLPPIARASIVLSRNDGRLPLCLAPVTSVALVFDRSRTSPRRGAHPEDVSKNQYRNLLSCL